MKPTRSACVCCNLLGGLSDVTTLKVFCGIHTYSAALLYDSYPGQLPSLLLIVSSGLFTSRFLIVDLMSLFNTSQ